jgi:hypothetical protein
MAGLGPAIHDFAFIRAYELKVAVVGRRGPTRLRAKIVDARDKPGHDEEWIKSRR